MQLKISWCNYFLVKITVLLFLALPLRANAEYLVDTAAIDLNESFLYWEDSACVADIDYVNNNPNLFEKKEKYSNSGVIQSVVWLRYDLTPLVTTEKILYISNPDLREVAFYVYKDGVKTRSTRTGRSVAHVEKTISSRYPAIKLSLQEGQPTTVYIRIENRNYPMYFPLTLLEEKAFYTVNNNEIIVEATFIGLLMMTLLIVIGIYFWIKRRQFVFYAFALFMIIVFYMAESGFFIEFHSSEWFQDRVKYVSTSLLMIFMTLFIKEAVSFHSIARYLIRVILGMNIFHVFFAILVLFIDVQHHDWFNPLQLFYFLTVQLYGVVFLLALGIEASKKNKMAFYAFFAYFFFVMTSIIKVLVINGAMHYSWTIFTVLKIGSLIEIGIFNYLIFSQIKSWYDERNRLLLEVNSYQQDLLEALVKGEERERKRLSEELHDSIGSMLSALKLNLPSIKTLTSNLNEKEKVRIEKGVKLLDDTLNEVRALSHSLQPPELGKYGLQAELRQYVGRLENEELKIHLRFDSWPDDLSQNLQLALFRIVQEGINNTVKHAKAKNLSIQFRGDDNELILTIEDDGIGFDVEQEKMGIGIKNMRSRLSNFEASFHMESALNKGTLIIVKVKSASN